MSTRYALRENDRLGVPLVDLRAALEPVRDQVMRGFEAAFDDMQLFLGPNVQAFESEFAELCEARHGIGVSSGSDALVCALKACGIGPGDEVIVPSHTFFASVEAVVQVGAIPVLADVEAERLTIDPGAIEPLLSEKTRCILPVHLYGYPADMDPILETARDRGLVVIEDAAQAHGARYKGRRCGSMGDASCFSFYFTKNLGAVGEAGFVATSSEIVAEQAKRIRDHGHTSKYQHDLIGHNFRLDELQAIVLRAKLPRLLEGNRRRNEIAARYRAELNLPGIRHLKPRDDCEWVDHVFPMLARDRDGLREHLTRAEIGTGIHYPIPAHQQKALEGHAYRAGEMTVTNAVCGELLSIPIYPELTESQQDEVIAAVRSFCKG